ncbi:bifunctional diguanylate cyclase/phosphodiesterase [Croceibacterium ferulae]|uniref:bifunctional diguanylate cyclase/phosphodiesterase n=1 Tax=Croceibacterium ferulae TaxID=1854641 RepID=UPI000EB48338|nr:EAL domain-containing protein [Croceibacterium ferulae]
MLTLFYCIRDQHDWRLLALALVLCSATCWATITLVRSAQRARNRNRLRWTALAATATGVGVWATHFIAMLGYDPGVAAGYEVLLTAISLAIVTAAAGLAFWLALRLGGWRGAVAGGIVLGCGISAMHYAGMAAVTFPGRFLFDRAGVTASVLLAIAPLIPALLLALDWRGARSALGAAMLVALAILLLHFTGMASITVVPDAARDLAGSSTVLSPMNLGTLIGVVASGLLALLGMASLFASRARFTIASREREFALLVQSVQGLAIYMLAPDGTVCSWNRGARSLKGYTEDEAIGLPLAAFYPPEDSPDAIAATLAAAAENGTFKTEGWRCRKDGSRFWAHVVVMAMRDDAGMLTGYAKVTRDMTQYRVSQERMAVLTANLDTALTNMHQGLCLFDAEERLLLANTQAATLSGFAAEEMQPGMTLADVIRLHAERRDGVAVTAETIEMALHRHRQCYRDPDGGMLVFNSPDDRTLCMRHRPLPAGGFVTTLEDITESRRAAARIEHMALHDALTGLPNRPGFAQSLDDALARSGVQGGQLAVIGIDLDRFKEINDHHGHAAGDLVLRQLGQAFRGLLQDGETIGRIGGDEFSACKPFTETDDLAEFVRRLEQALETPIILGEQRIIPGGSIGVAVYPADGTSREELVNNADLAMYRAKGTLGQTTCFYQTGMDQSARARRFMASELREAAEREELRLVYQVQRSLTDHTITGYEALLRWHHPVLGWVSPADFIPVAEECGAILPIGEWVLRTACRQAAEWPRPWRVAINLSPVQLMHVDLPALVAQALLESGLAAHRLELEVTESAVIGDKLRALHVLRGIKALGVTIAIDDFGTSYSSLDTLNSFPFDKIKIDRSFLMDSSGSERARAIIRAVLALGRSLDVPVLAEGLESADQLILLRAEGCDQAQGYFFGRPVPLDHAEITRQEGLSVVH